MSKEIETILCEVCESQYKLVYDVNQTSGYAKFCPFCADVPRPVNDTDDDEGMDDD